MRHWDWENLKELESFCRENAINFSMQFWEVSDELSLELNTNEVGREYFAVKRVTTIEEATNRLKKQYLEKADA